MAQNRLFFTMFGRFVGEKFDKKFCQKNLSKFMALKTQKQNIIVEKIVLAKKTAKWCQNGPQNGQNGPKSPFFHYVGPICGEKIGQKTFLKKMDQNLWHKKPRNRI